MPAAPVSHGRVFAIAAPAMLANLTTPLLGIVGTAVIGRLGEAHLLGAVAISALVFDCLFWLFGFLRLSAVALAAQALGARDPVEQRAVLVRALVIAAAIGIVLIALQVPLAVAIYRLMGGSPAVTESAQAYFFIRIWSAPFVLANYAVLGWLIGVARAKTALGIQIVANLINMVVTTILVLGFGLGVAGAAFGSLVAEAAGTATGLTIVTLLQRGGGRIDWAVALDRTKLMRLLRINRDIMIRTAALITAFLFFTAQGARGGDTLLAANAVLHNFTLIGSFFLDGFATAAEQLCGHSFGARNRAAFRRSVRLILGWGFGFGVATSVLFLAAGDVLIDTMTASPEVRQAARAFMLLAALAPVAGVLAFAFDGIYIGATWTRDMRNLMLISLAIFIVTWWALTPLENRGLWLALLAFFISRGALQALRYPALMRASFGA